MSDKENKEYLDKNIKPVLEKLIPDLLIDKPKELLSYIRKWLDSNESKNVVPCRLNPPFLFRNFRKEARPTCYC